MIFCAVCLPYLLTANIPMTYSLRDAKEAVPKELSSYFVLFLFSTLFNVHFLSQNCLFTGHYIFIEFTFTIWQRPNKQLGNSLYISIWEDTTFLLPLKGIDNDYMVFHPVNFNIFFFVQKQRLRLFFLVNRSAYYRKTVSLFRGWGQLFLHS